MKKLLVLALACLLFTFACSDAGKQTVTSNVTNTNASPAPNASRPPVDDGIPRISLADAKRDFDNGAAIFIDTHPAHQYEAEHIPGAINLQPNTIKQNMDKVPKGKKIIAYCSCGSEQSSGSLIAELHKAGITNSYALLGGTSAWREAGYPFETKK